MRCVLVYYLKVSPVNSFVMIKFFVTKILAVVLLLLIIPPVALAQTGVIDSSTSTTGTSTLPKSPLSFTQSGVEALPGTVNCFDYYTFGSVQVDIEPSVTSTVSGTPITFAGNIVNNNPYPIVAGQLLVKVYKTKESLDTGSYQNGYPVVDQFFALEDITVPAHGKTPVIFNWEVPAYLMSGDYELNTFFMTEKRFNLIGLPFTDDVTGNKVNFSVLGQAASGVDFDKNSVTLNGNLFSFAAFPPHFTATEPVTASATLVNATADAKTIPVTWTLYNWAGERVENKLDTVTETVTLAPGEKKVISYTATKATGAISFVQAVATYKDTKSILNIRFNRDDKNEIRLNFPSVLAYPLVAGEEVTIFSCLHSTSQAVVDGGKLVLTLTDSAGAEIHTYTYDGSVTGAMMGVKDTFVPVETVSDFTLTASLFKDSQKVEEVIINYNCHTIDETLCTVEPVSTSTSDIPKSNDFFPAPRVLGILLGMGILCGIVWYLKRRRDIKRTSEEWSAPPSDTLMMWLVWCCLIPFSATIVFIPQAVWAKSETVTVTTSGGLYHKYNGGFSYDYRDSSGNEWHQGLYPSTAAITYNAEVEDAVTGEAFTNNEAIPIGTRIRVHQIDRQNTDISWFGTGYGFDSPYGRWIAEAAAPAVGCAPDGFVNDVHVVVKGAFGNTVKWHSARVYAYLSVNPPEPTVVSPSENLSCTGNVCTVTGLGPISVGLQFPETAGKFYFRYYVYDWWYWRLAGPIEIPDFTCITSNDPMRLAWSNNDFILPVPTKTISFTFRSNEPSNPPTTPIITSRLSNTSFTDDRQVFAIESTDPDGDKIKYGIDWDNNGKVDLWIPGADLYEDSDVPVHAPRTWIDADTYIFKAIAQDENGAKSRWAAYTVTITPHPPEVALNAAGCTIVLGGVDCQGRVGWQYQHANGPYLVADGAVEIGNTNMSDTKPITLSGGRHIITASNRGRVLDSKTVEAACVSGTAWYGGSCVNDHSPVLTLNVKQSVLPMNGSTDISWTISDFTMNTCTLSGPGVPGVAITTSPGTLPIGPFTTSAIFELVCTSELHPDIKAQTTVEVVPKVYET